MIYRLNESFNDDYAIEYDDIFSESLKADCFKEFDKNMYMMIQEEYYNSNILFESVGVGVYNEGVLGNIKDFIVRVFSAIAKWIKNLWVKLKEFFSNLFNKNKIRKKQNEEFMKKNEAKCKEEFENVSFSVSESYIDCFNEKSSSNTILKRYISLAEVRKLIDKAADTDEKIISDHRLHNLAKEISQMISDGDSAEEMLKDMPEEDMFGDETNEMIIFCKSNIIKAVDDAYDSICFGGNNISSGPKYISGKDVSRLNIKKISANDIEDIVNNKFLVDNKEYDMMNTDLRKIYKNFGELKECLYATDYAEKMPTIIDSFFKKSLKDVDNIKSEFMKLDNNVGERVKSSDNDILKKNYSTNMNLIKSILQYLQKAIISIQTMVLHRNRAIIKNLNGISNQASMILRLYAKYNKNESTIFSHLN